MGRYGLRLRRAWDRWFTRTVVALAEATKPPEHGYRPPTCQPPPENPPPGLPARYGVDAAGSRGCNGD